VSAARLAAQCLALLGPVNGPVAVLGPRATRLRAALARELPAARDGDVPRGAVMVFLGAAVDPASRQSELRGLEHRLPVGAPLLLVDHNQPRALWRRVPAWVRLALGGIGPARARYPAARELATLGFAVERLRLARGERVQLVLARRR
jgi:hypothetical protein